MAANEVNIIFEMLKTPTHFKIVLGFSRASTRLLFFLHYTFIFIICCFGWAKSELLAGSVAKQPTFQVESSKALSLKYNKIQTRHRQTSSRHRQKQNVINSRELQSFFSFLFKTRFDVKLKLEIESRIKAGNFLQNKSNDIH